MVKRMSSIIEFKNRPSVHCIKEIQLHCSQLNWDYTTRDLALKHLVHPERTGRILPSMGRKSSFVKTVSGMGVCLFA